MSSIEIEGKTLEEAIEKACSLLNLPKDMLEIEVLSTGSPGILGLIKKAKIKVSPKGANRDEDLDKAREVLEKILMGLDQEAKVDGVRTDQGMILLSIQGASPGLLIGKKGQTLDAIQHLVNKIVNKASSKKLKIIVDTETYRKRREKSLTNLALRLGEKAKRLGKPIVVDPMNAHDRRIIHLTLQGDHMLSTKSSGEGTLRKVVIFPRKRGSVHNLEK